MSTIKSIFFRPYFYQPAFGVKLSEAFFFGLFVFLFLYIFQPFQLNVLGDQLLNVSLTFGGITFFVMIFLNVLIPLVFPAFFNEERWNLGKQLFYTLINVWVIGTVNFLYFQYIQDHELSFNHFLWFQLVTVLVGAFPVTFVLFFNERNSRKKYEKKARGLTSDLAQKKNKNLTDNSSIILPSQNKSEELTLDLNKLHFIKAADNYVEIYYFDNGLKKEIIRNTLKIIDSELNQYANFFRCHKSYLVNLDKIQRISGNAQGYKLYLNNVEDFIPVSRKWNDVIKEKLAN